MFTILTPLVLGLHHAQPPPLLRHGPPLHLRLDPLPRAAAFMQLNNASSAPVDDAAAKMAQTAREIVHVSRDAIAFAFRVTPPYVDLGVGCLLFLVSEATAQVACGGESVASQLAAIGLFAGSQQLVGLPTSEWLQLRANPEQVDRSPFFQSGSPAAPVTAAFAFGIAVVCVASLSGVNWLPAPREFPEPSRALDIILVKPAVEELFFRAWLLRAFERAAGDAPVTRTAGLLASGVLFGLWQVPISTALSGGPPSLLLFEALGIWLAFLYQRSGGSLPFAIATHCTFNLAVTLLREVQLTSTMPF